ncbi:MAG TPA: RHS repeat-associated core domain-containing protein [Polyangiaceae bacterium]
MDSGPVATVAEAISNPPTVTPPARAASAAVGAIPASGSVGADGQYHYAIPISVPEGRNGMAPNLSLQYSSAGNDGMLGVGWALGGLSSITRCPATEGQDGSPDRVLFNNAADRYCLDGRRLVLVSGTNGAVSAVYKTEVDSGVRVRITVADSIGPKTWQVDDGAGRMAVYGVYGGNALTRRTLDANGNTSQTQTVYLNWPKVQEQDAFNNAISYTYNNLGGDSTSNGVDLPVQIVYGNCSGTQPACPFANWRQVTFSYQDRPAGDQFETYVNGVRIKRKVRLTRILAQIGGSSGGFTTINDYRILYQQSTVSKRSLVTSVNRCDAAGVCMPATMFEWAGLGSSFGTYRTAQLSNANPAAFSTLLEGAGFPDDSTMAVLDVNGDGNDDVIVKRWSRLDNVTLNLPNGTANGANPQTNYNEDLLLLGDGGGYFQPPVVIDHDGDGVTRRNQPCQEMEIMDLGGAMPIDLDGDGSVELVARVNTGCPFKEITGNNHQYIRVTPNFPVADLPAGYRWTVFRWDPAARAVREWHLDRIEAIPYGGSLQFIDLDGDGLRDLASAPVLANGVRGDWKISLARLTPQLIGPPLLSYGTAESTGLQEEGGVMRSVTVGDLDADGREDLISANVDLTSAQFGIQTVFRIGASGIGALVTRSVEPNQVTGYEFRLDINGDGLKDTLYRNLQNTNWKIRINTGNGYAAPSVPGGPEVFNVFSHMFPETEIRTPNLYKVDSGIRIADLNGDRRDDVLVLALNNDAQVATFGWSTFSARSVRVMYSNGAGFDPPVNIADRGGVMGPMSVPTKRWPFQTLADVDGNGLPDLVEFLQNGSSTPTRVLTVHRLANLPAGTDVITRIKDERGIAADITMDALSGASYARFGTGTDVHLPTTHYADAGEACVYPAACTARGRAVRELRDYRAPRVTQVAYDYRGARVDRQGRGSLGFKNVGAVDAVSGRYTVQTFAQSAQAFASGGRTVFIYPDIDTPRRTEVSYPPVETSPSFPELAAVTSGRSASVSTWAPTYRTGYPVLKQRTVSTTDIFQHPSTRHSTFTTRTDFDATYPLTTREEVLFNDLVAGTIARTTTATTYTVDAALWLLRRPLHVTVSKESNEDVNDSGCTATTCVSSGVTYDYTYVTGTAAPLTRTRRHGGEELVHRWVRATNGGMVTAERDEAALGTFVHETQFAYDASGTTVIGRRTPAGLESWTLIDPNTGWLVAAIDPNGVKTVYTRDGFGRPTRIARDDGFVQTMQYRVGRVDGFPNNAGSWAVNYDERGRKVRSRWSTFDNRVGDEQIQYAATGQPTLSSYGIEGQTLTRRSASSYDRDGRLVRTVKGQSDAPGSGDIITLAYDTKLGVVTATDPRGDTKTTTTDQRGLVKRIVWRSAQPTSGASSLTTDYRYDETGGLAVVKGNGPTEKMQHDGLGRLTRWETVDPGTTVAPVRGAVTYDAFGNQINVTQDGISVTFGYDADGRVTSRTAPNNENVSFVWDTAPNGKGKLASATGAGGHQSRFAYDTLGRLQEARDVFSTGESLSVGYTYDLVGRLSVLRYPETSTADVPGHTTTGGLQVRHVYGVNGQLARLEDVGTNTVLWQANTRHVLGSVMSSTDAAGLVTTTNIEEGVVMPTDRTTRTPAGAAIASQTFGRDVDLMPFAHQFTLNGATTTEFYSHNGYAQTTNYRREGSVNPVNATVTYTVASRDTGNINGITVATPSSAPDFPNNETYTKITNSERLSAWAQTSGPSETIAYDNAGRIQSTTGSGGLANRTYTYNSFNLPTRIVNGNVTTDFTYDAFGKRTKKRRDANNQVLYVGNVYEQRTVASPTTRDAVFRLVTDEGVVGEIVENWTNGAVTRRMFQNDRQGSPFFMTVGTSASLYGAFSPYGRRINSAPAQTMSNLGYTGHVMDDDLGLINMKGRIYDTRLRRFLTRDRVLDAPFDGPGGHNAYGYVRGNPIALIDPSGFEDEEEGEGSIKTGTNINEELDYDQLPEVVIEVHTGSHDTNSFGSGVQVQLVADFLASISQASAGPTVQADSQQALPSRSANDVQRNNDYYRVDVRLPSGTSGRALFEKFAARPNSVGDQMFDALNEFALRGGGLPKLGSVYDIDIAGPDNGSIVVTDLQLGAMGGHMTVEAIATKETGMHPENGWREFGYVVYPDGMTRFYTRGNSVGAWPWYQYGPGPSLQTWSWHGLMNGFANEARTVGGSMLGVTEAHWK